MTSFSNVSEIVNRNSGGNSGNPEIFHWMKDAASMTFQGGTFKSLWLADGIPGPGTTPGAASNPTGATAGAFRMLDPGGGRQRWLRGMFGSAWGAGRLIFYDRLMHMGGLSGTTTGAQTVSGSVNRYTGQESLGNIILAEVYTAVGATLVDVSCNYVDKDGNTRASGTHQFGQSVVRNPGDVAVIPYNTTDGANSVASVSDATISATTGTAGNWGITIARPLFEIDIGSVDTGGFGHGALRTLVEDIELKTGACLGVLFGPTSTTVNYIRGWYSSVER